MAPRFLDRLSILAAAALFSTGGAAIKYCGFGGWEVAGLRSAVAGFLLAILFPKAWRGWSWRVGLVAIAYAGTMISFVLSNKLTTAANTIFLQSAAPIYVLALSPWLLREPISRRDGFWIALVAGGLGLFFVGQSAPTRSAPDPLTGNLIALVAGVFWAFTLMGLRWLERGSEGNVPSGISAVLFGNLLAAAIALPVSFPIEGGEFSDWAVVGYRGGIQIGLAYVLLTYGFRRVRAFEGTLLILLEPVLSPVWAWLFQGEVPGDWALVGGTVILGTCVAKTVCDREGAPTGVAPIDGR